MENKPELLLPAGNVESFFAAIQAGADAVYLGLKNFNARGRAANFSNNQLYTLLKEAHKNKVLIYVTLNTVLKNKEIPMLIEYLHFLNLAGVDGIIIQDWGVFYIAKKYFPKLKIHASTQMGIHNSLGTCYSAKKGFKRVVLARELTLKELTQINNFCTIETEIFVHGALCYSFSGMCLYSSYLGGWGANRGLCTQPCRRVYNLKNNQKFVFNLKDNQLIDYLEKFAEIGVNSLKIEGRMKSGEYTYRVAKGYRTALDDFSKTQEAKEWLDLDFGRQKTTYFFGSDIGTAISQKTATGILIGKVEQVVGSKIIVSSNKEIVAGFRLRFQHLKTGDRETVKVKIVEKKEDYYEIEKGKKQIFAGSTVYLSGINDMSFPSKLDEDPTRKTAPVSAGFKRKILNELKLNGKRSKEEIYVRINSMEWLRKIHFNEVDGIFFSFSKITWSRFNPKAPFIQKNLKKVFVELPKFIPENSIEFYKNLVKNLISSGIKNFVISHLSQKLIIPEGGRIFTNENVYVFNDAAVKMLAVERIESFTYPLEIDFETLETISNKNGIVPVYFYPELFYSRMPVDIENNEKLISDDLKSATRRFRKNGITCIVSEQPVAFLQYKNRLSKAGFYRFLIDLSYEQPSKNKLKTIKSRLFRSEQIQPSTTFNFVKGLK